MKILFCVLFFTSLASADMAFAADDSMGTSTAADSEAAERSCALSAARSLCPGYFVKRYQAVGEELKCSLQLNKPTAVEGWQGRWRMHGVATLRHYKDPEADRSLVAREDAIRNNNSLSASQIRSRIESLYFIRSEIVEFDVDVTNVSSTPEIDVTIR